MTPSEDDVMETAGRWSLDPTAIDDAVTRGPGIHGLPPSASQPAGVPTAR